MKHAYLTSTGRVRENNEDQVGYFTNKAGIALAIVADGIGGHQGGEVASEMAVEHLGHYFSLTDFTQPEDGASWLKEHVAEENALIHKTGQQFKDLKGMGTTIVCLMFFGENYLVAHIGDSRAYLLRHGEVRQLTQDHSLVNEMVQKGEITRQEAQNHPRKNIITRTLGIEETVKLDYDIEPLEVGDLFMLTTDGLTNMVSADQLNEVLKEDNLNLKGKCQLLIKEANQAGGPDNITVLIAENSDVEAI